MVSWFRSPGIVWAQHAGEESVRAGAYVVCAAMMAAQAHTMAAVDWDAVLSQAAFAALLAVAASVASLRVPNGTASFVPRVIAKSA